MIAWRIFSRERSSGRNDVIGRARAAAALEVRGRAATDLGNGGGVAASGAGCASTTKTGSGGGAVVKGGSDMSSGVVTREATAAPNCA